MYKAKATDSVGPIKDVSDKITDHDLEMCNIFNLQFLSVFTNENINQMPDIDQVFNGSDEDLLNDALPICLPARRSPGEGTTPGRFCERTKSCRREPQWQDIPSPSTNPSSPHLENS